MEFQGPLPIRRSETLPLRTQTTPGQRVPPHERPRLRSDLNASDFLASSKIRVHKYGYGEGRTLPRDSSFDSVRYQSDGLPHWPPHSPYSDSEWVRNDSRSRTRSPVRDLRVPPLPPAQPPMGSSSKLAMLARSDKGVSGFRTLGTAGIKSTISKDNTAGEQARQASLFAQYAKNKRPYASKDPEKYSFRRSNSTGLPPMNTSEPDLSDMLNLNIPLQTGDTLNDFGFGSFLPSSMMATGTSGPFRVAHLPPLEFSGAFANIDADEIGTE